MNTNSTISAFVWSDRLDTGLPEVDKQHRVLVEMINQLGTACALGAEFSEISPVFDELVRYAQYHFATEDKLMETFQVSAAHQDEHHKAHDDFRQQVTLALQSIRQSPEHSEAQVKWVLEYLTMWLLTHIMGTDKKYSGFLNANGVR